MSTTSPHLHLSSGRPPFIFPLNCLILAFLAWIVTPVPGVHAAGTVATPTAAALSAALTGGGTVTLACNGTITLSSATTITSDTWIDGSGHTIAISGNHVVRVFNVNPGVTLTLVHLTVESGFDNGFGGGLANNGGTVNLLGCTFLGNLVTGVNGSTGSAGLTHNTGPGGTGGNGSGGSSAVGGGIYNNAGFLNISHSILMANSVVGGNGGDGGGGGDVYDSSMPGTGGVGGHGGSAQGGGVYNTGSGIVQIIASIFSANTAVGGVGGEGGTGGYVQHPGSLYIAGTGGAAGIGGQGAGGSLYNASGSVTILDTTVSSNTATGGIGGQGAFAGNSQGGTGPTPGGTGGVGQGGALYNFGTISINSSTLAANAGIGGLGGKANEFSGTPPRGGTGGQGEAGALYNLGNASILNSTVWTNSATGGDGGKGGYTDKSGNGGNGGNGRSGAIYDGIISTSGHLSGVPLYLTNVTIAGNVSVGGNGGQPSAYDGAQPGAPGIGIVGGVYNLGIAYGPSTYVTNTILAKNMATDPTKRNARGLTDDGNNISDDGSAAFSLASSHNNTDPQLLSFGYNGGVTQTVTISAVSPAINAGNDGVAPPTDQRGAPRSGKSDIGAYEFLGVAPYASGFVTTENGKGLASVTVTLTQGGSMTSTLTNGVGYYHFDSVAGGAYTLTPSKTGYTFNPGSQGESAAAADVDFTAFPAAINPPSGLVSWWAGDGSTKDLVGPNNGVAEGGLAYGFGKVGQAFSLNGSDADVRVPASASLNVGTGAKGWTLDAWIKPSNVSTLQPLFEWNNGSGGIGVHFWIAVPYGNGGTGSLYANLVDVNGGSRILSTGKGAVVAGAWQHLALKYDVAALTASIYLNGVKVLSAGFANPSGVKLQTSSNLYIGDRPGSSRFKGDIDEAHLFNRPLSDVEILAIYNAGGGGLAKPAPPTISSLSPTLGPAGTSVTISGANLGSATAVKLNGIAMAIQTNSATSIKATVPAGATSGPISVTTAIGTGTSAGGFTVLQAPYIFGQVTVPGGAGLGGVTITRKNSTTNATVMTTTDAGGYYGFSAVPTGAGYTVTPTVAAGSAANPVAWGPLPVTSAASNHAGINFLVLKAPYIAGRVIKAGAGVSGVTMTLKNTTTSATVNTTTDGNGFYGFQSIANGSYTLTPALAGLTFTPPASSPMAITSATSNFPNINFSGN